MALYLVTGGAGFIGSHLVTHLVKAGHRVRVLDNFATGHRRNLEDVADRIEFIEGSLTHLEDCRRAVLGVDGVFHQAALPSVPKSLALPLETHDVNINGTLNLLVASRDAHVARVVYAASSSAYGDTPSLPKEESMPALPKSPYAVQKYTGELYCRVFAERYGLPTVALRYFNVFGPKQDPNSTYAAVIPRFIRACLSDTAPTIYGDGETTRDFTYIDNVVLANVLAMTSPHVGRGEAINVACGERLSLNTLAQVIRERVGRGQPPNYEAERVGDVRHSLASISRAENLLGYRPCVDFMEGISRTVAWFEVRPSTAVTESSLA